MNPPLRLLVGGVANEPQDGASHMPDPSRHPLHPAAMSAVIHATFTISSGEAPRERSLHGRANPCTMGPMARAPASRSTSLYPMLPASRFGKTRMLASPFRSAPGDFRSAIAGTS